MPPKESASNLDSVTDPCITDASGAGASSGGRSDFGDNAESGDAELIAAAVAGDQHAYGQLVLRYQDRLYASLLRMTDTAEDAQDLAQEVFVQAYIKLDTFGGRSAFYTWLYRIAFNRSVSHRRKRREKASLDTLRESAGVDPQDPGGRPDRPLEEAERSELLHAAIGSLADEQREVLVMREMEGFDYQQIAELIGVPIGTVRSRLFRARLQLKERLVAVLGESMPSPAPAD